MNNAELERIIENERFIFEDLPKDGGVQALFHEAVQGKQKVCLVVKGFRPMYQGHYPYGFNYFWIGNCNEDYKSIPVPTVCRLAKIDPALVQDAYFSFRNDGQSLRQHPETDNEISKIRKQIVTNLFPFPTIEWQRESGSSGEINLIDTLHRTPPFLDREEIHRLTRQNRQTEKALLRHLRRLIRKKGG